MAFDITATLDALLTHLKGAGHFEHVQIGEPKSPPSTTGLTGAVFMSSVGVIDITLGNALESHIVTLRTYLNMMHEPQKDIELKLSAAVSKIITDLLADWNLGGAVHGIDSSGEFGASIGTTWGYLELGGTIYRTADITLPIMVDSAVTLTQ